MRKSLFQTFVIALVALCGAPDCFAAKPTTDVFLSGNLDPSAATGSASSSPASFSELVSSSALNDTVSVFDSAGVTHALRIFFFHIQNRQWSVSVFIDAADTGGVAGVPLSVGQTLINFNSSGESSNGKLRTSIAWTGADVGVINFRFTNFVSKTGSSKLTRVDIRPRNVDATCSSLQSCVDGGLTDLTVSCFSSSQTCAADSDSYAVSAGQLSERALDDSKCLTKKFSKRSACRACFDKAAAPLKLRFDGKLFHGLLARAVGLINHQRDLTCKSLHN